MSEAETEIDVLRLYVANIFRLAATGEHYFRNSNSILLSVAIQEPGFALVPEFVMLVQILSQRRRSCGLLFCPSVGTARG